MEEKWYTLAKTQYFIESVKDDKKAKRQRLRQYLKIIAVDGVRSLSSGKVVR